jgi:hypothetical protein
MDKKLVTVTIPIYKEEPSRLEIFSLQQCLRILGNYPITFIAPNELNISWYEDNCKGVPVTFERFDSGGFEKYNRMLLSSAFYARFRQYKYLLIYHLDAFVFKDDLTYWCQQGYDYIGAAIYHQPFAATILNSSRIRRQLLRRGILKNNYLANGGFSLRKVSTFYWNCLIYQKLIQKWGNFYEDLFWCFKLPVFNWFFKMPRIEIAERFAVEKVNNYEIYRSSKNSPMSFPPGFKQIESTEDFKFELPDDHILVDLGDISLKEHPFGCHGWIQYNQNFWKQHIQEYGYHV